MPILRCDEVRSAAGAARAEARELRRESSERRVALRRTASDVARRLTTCQAAFGDLDGRELIFRSAWSELLWRPPGGDLDHVLVSHDGEI
jgi:hypothetical protein